MFKSEFAFQFAKKIKSICNALNGDLEISVAFNFFRIKS